MENSPESSVFLDGTSNKKRAVQTRAGVQLEIRQDEELLASWPWQSIRLAGNRSGPMRIRSTEGPELARLTVTDPEFAKTIQAYCPNLHNEGKVKRASAARIIGLSVLAAISILFVGLYGVPYAADRLAPLLPQSVDARIGEMVDGQVRTIFGKKTCEDPAGKQAYDILVVKLASAAGMTIPLRAAVLDSPIKNAIALPGGRVYFFRGLLQEAKNPDEFAGVLAHELGHVHHRDSLRKLLQAGGTSYLLGLLFGDVSGAGAVIFAARTLLDKAYTRQAEYRADGFAIDAFKRLGRSPEPMGELLVRVTGKQGGENGKGKSSILASHPFSEDRLERMKKARPENLGAPLLDAAQWNALKGICANTPAANGTSK